MHFTKFLISLSYLQIIKINLLVILVSVSGLTLASGDSNGYHYPKPKIPFPDLVCPPESNGIFPDCEYSISTTSHGECEPGFTGTFPDCKKVKPKKCRRPFVGFIPNCFTPPCPPGYYGNYPKCSKSPDQLKCPPGTYGVFPMCEVKCIPQNCQGGSTGESTVCGYLPPPLESLLATTSIPTSPLLPVAVPTIPETTSHSLLAPNTSPVSLVPTYPIKITNASQLPITIQVPVPAVCETGFTGTFPDCKKVVKTKKCRRPLVGAYPNCFRPPCPPGYLGTYPKCERPEQLLCPLGSSGVFPNCEITITTEKCAEGLECTRPTSSSPQPLPPISSPLPPPTQLISNINEKDWDEFKAAFNKTYNNETEENNRQHIFFENQKIIDAHNKLFEQGLKTYSLAINKFSDWSQDELLRVSQNVTSRNRSNLDESDVIDGDNSHIKDLRSYRISTERKNFH